MIVLGLETSCDETAAAVVTDDRRILANKVLSQLDEHRPFGGVVPEIAARSHLDHIGDLVEQAMAEAGLDFRRTGRRGGDRRTRPDRRRLRRRHDRQGDCGGP